MSRITDAVQALREFVPSPILTYGAFPPSEQQILQEPCYRNLLHLCRDATPAERNDVLSALAPLLASAENSFPAGQLAMVCGILVEWGADPSVALPATLDKLLVALALAEPIAPLLATKRAEELFAEYRRFVTCWKSLHYLILPAMTMLCLDVRSRHLARRDERLMAYLRSLAPHHPDVKFLKRLFDFFDGEELIVLHPHQKKGYRVRALAIASNFHLFTLLQDALVGDPAAGLLAGPRASRMVLATARGEVPHDRLVSDSAVFHYTTCTGAAVVGEETPHAIPLFEGDRVILLGPPVNPSRSWESSFFTNLHDALRSKVEIVEILSAGEVELRLGRIRNAPRIPSNHE